jgi:hypothetical protein
MYDSTYGDSWGGFSMSDVTVSDQTYSDISAGMDNYAQAAESAQDHNQYAGSPWSPQNMQREMLTAGDQLPSRQFEYPGTDDAFGWWGESIGRTVGRTIGGPVGGQIGDYIGGRAGETLGDYYNDRQEENYDGNR